MWILDNKIIKTGIRMITDVFEFVMAKARLVNLLRPACLNCFGEYSFESC